MTNRPKQIGTSGETAVVKALRVNGFEGSERRALAGSLDLGDILVCPGVVCEVKTGKHAKTASHGQIIEWIAETERERRNAKAALAFLVIQRTGFGVDRAHMWSTWFHDLADLIETHAHPARPIPFSTTLQDAAFLMRLSGWGTPLPAAPQGTPINPLTK